MKMYFSKIAQIRKYELSKVANNKPQSLLLSISKCTKEGSTIASPRSYVHHNKTLTILASLYFSTKAPYFKIFKHHNKKYEKKKSSLNHIVCQLFSFQM